MPHPSLECFRSPARLGTHNRWEGAGLSSGYRSAGAAIIRTHRVIARVAVGSQLTAIGAHLALKEHVQRRLACIKYVLESRVRCPHCKASLTDLLPSLALGSVAFCPRCGLSLIDRYTG